MADIGCFVKKNTPLALVFSLAGCFAFGDMDANFSM